MVVGRSVASALGGLQSLNRIGAGAIWIRGTGGGFCLRAYLTSENLIAELFASAGKLKLNIR